MVTTTQNIIKEKYSTLIHHISMISDDVRIEDRESALNLTIYVYADQRKLISFNLSETSNTLEVEWGVLGDSIGHWCFPDYFDQNYMFKTLISKIADWYNEVINSSIGNILEQVQSKVDSKINIPDNK